MTVPEDTASTSQKTHRYLRLSLVLLVFALLVSVAVETVVVSWQPFELGWDLLPSISHYFYTPARSVFVGALVSASVVLLALSGRNRATTLLDIAAVFAPLIAIVPTGIAPTQRVDGLTCPVSGDCVPAEYLDEVRSGVAVYAVVVITTVTVTAVIRARKRIRTPSATLVSIVAIAVALGVAALAFVPGLNEGFPFPVRPFPTSIHFLATLLFFGTFAAVPVFHSRGPLDERETAPTRRQQLTYRWIAGLMIADLLLLVAALALRGPLGDIPLVLIGETVALLLFAWFWWVQTFQRWDDADAPSIAARHG